MAFKALDTTQNTSPFIPCLTQSGITAVGRYYTRKRNSWKIVKLAEVQALSAAGIRLWPVYQIIHRDRSHFSATIGKSEANDALDYAISTIGQPLGSAIYFAADYDASQSDLNTAIIPHFEAVGAAFAAAGSPYRIGVYGSGLTCKTLLDRGLVKLTWLSQSSGFQGTPDFKASRRWNLLQLLPVSNFCNFEDKIDPDIINDDIGDIGAFTLQAGQQPLVSPPSPVPPGPSMALPSGGGTGAPPMGGAPTSPTVGGAPVFHGPLTRGMLGSPEVKALQMRLNELKFGPLVSDGDFGERTEEAVLHFQARNSAADGHPLAIDGEVGSGTWAALFGPGAVPSTQPLDASTPLRELVIDIAASQIGVVEQPVGSNRGPEVDAYIRATGLDPTADSFPWCVCFLYWCFGQAAQVKSMTNPLPKTAGVISLWNLGRNSAGHVVRASEANAQTVKPGMIFLLDTGGGKGHAGLVVEVSGDQIVTIEGNTNQGGSREGFGVFRRSSRPIKQPVLLGYLDFCE